MSAASRAASVAAHYNQRQQGSASDRKRSEVFHLRQFNNWVKATLLAHYGGKGRPGANGVASVLDLACGKGGDLKKYWNFPELRRYTGMDIAHSSLCDLVQRFNSQQGARGHAPVQARLVCADLGVANLSEHKVLEDGEKFDIVSIQFALHYMFDTRARATRFFDNLAGRIAAGGVFVCTIPDADMLVRRARNLPPGQRAFGNKHFKVEFDEASMQRQWCLGDNPFGCAYKFTLTDSVTDCEEYLVPYKLLTQLAARAGLEPVATYNFHDFFRKFSTIPGHQRLLHVLKVMDREGSMSPEEWEVAGMYRVCVFTAPLSSNHGSVDLSKLSPLPTQLSTTAITNLLEATTEAAALAIASGDGAHSLQATPAHTGYVPTTPPLEPEGVTGEGVSEGGMFRPIAPPVDEAAAAALEEALRITSRQRTPPPDRPTDSPPFPAYIPSTPPPGFQGWHQCPVATRGADSPPYPRYLASTPPWGGYHGAGADPVRSLGASPVFPFTPLAPDDGVVTEEVGNSTAPPAAGGARAPSPAFPFEPVLPGTEGTLRVRSPSPPGDDVFDDPVRFGWKVAAQPPARTKLLLKPQPVGASDGAEAKDGSQGGAAPAAVHIEAPGSDEFDDPIGRIGGTYKAHPPTLPRALNTSATAEAKLVRIQTNGSQVWVVCGGGIVPHLAVAPATTTVAITRHVNELSPAASKRFWFDVVLLLASLKQPQAACELWPVADVPPVPTALTPLQLPFIARLFIDDAEGVEPKGHAATATSKPKEFATTVPPLYQRSVAEPVPHCAAGVIPQQSDEVPLDLAKFDNSVDAGVTVGPAGLSPNFVGWMTAVASRGSVVILRSVGRPTMTVSVRSTDGDGAVDYAAGDEWLRKAKERAAATAEVAAAAATPAPAAAAASAASKSAPAAAAAGPTSAPAPAAGAAGGSGATSDSGASNYADDMYGAASSPGYGDDEGDTGYGYGYSGYGSGASAYASVLEGDGGYPGDDDLDMTSADPGAAASYIAEGSATDIDMGGDGGDEDGGGDADGGYADAAYADAGYADGAYADAGGTAYGEDDGENEDGSGGWTY